MASKFQQRHYEAVAAAIKKSRTYHGNSLYDELVLMFENDNDKFDPEKFWKASEPDTERKASNG